MTDFASHIIGATADPEIARAMNDRPRGSGRLARFVSRHATPLAVVIGIPTIFAAAYVFTAHDGDNYDPDRFGTAVIETEADYSDGRWTLNGAPLTVDGECPTEDSCDNPTETVR